MKQCVAKGLQFKVPIYTCNMCGATINPGSELCMVALKWGEGQTVCKKCYDEHETVRSMQLKGLVE